MDRTASTLPSSLPELLQAPSSVNGVGIFATRDLIEGYVVGIIEGPVVSYEDATDFAIEPTAGLYIETEPPYRYINHSCYPNLELLGLRALVTRRAIRAGAELFLDYSTFIHDHWTMNCLCGTSACRGVISGSTILRL